MHARITQQKQHSQRNLTPSENALAVATAKACWAFPPAVEATGRLFEKATNPRACCHRCINEIQKRLIGKHLRI